MLDTMSGARNWRQKQSHACELLAERYPEIYYALTFGEIAPAEPQPGIKAEIERFSKKMPSDEIEVLYLFGLELGAAYPILRTWLQKDSSRQLIILEDDLTVFASWLHYGIPEDILTEAQVHLRYVPGKAAWKGIVAACARDFPCRHIDVLASETYAKNRSRFFASLRLQLLRKTGLAYTYFTEALYAHVVIDTNLLHNVPHLARSFEATRLAQKFQNIPAVICGAGPSLGPAAPLLSTLEDRALILAGGSAVTALGNLGIVPHIALAIDPNKEEHERFKASVVQEVPLLYGHRLHHDVFATFNGPIGYMRSGTGGGGETWFEEKLGITGETLGHELSPEAMSITTMAFAAAVAMGCNPIILIGVDLSYIDSMRYAPGVMRDSSVNPAALAKQTEHLERLIKRKNNQGKWALTLVRWVMESEALGSFAKKYPRTDIFNASDKGLRIPNLPHLALDTWIKTYAHKTHDLRGKLHAESESLKFSSITPENIQASIHSFIASLYNLQQLGQEAHKEIDRLERELHASLDSGKMLAIDMQCQEEPAFAFLESVGLAFDHLMRRQFNLLRQANTPEDRQRRLRFIRAKWTHIESVVSHYLHLYR